ncbi:MAG TPA: uroporphyrinogen decarboxylase family protein [Candidatus Lokiarchaeia archaeon]|nr:uroporphyrinogen decarboxylase family protein [Candidatus Lokiarchaeia archaeon]
MPPEMTSRERVLAALNHKQPDRVPIDLGGNQSGIHVKAYKNLLAHLGIEDEHARYSDVVQHIAYPCEELLQRFHADVRYVRPVSNYRDVDDPGLEIEGPFQGIHDQFGVFWGIDASKNLDDILYLDPAIHPLSDATSLHDVDTFPWPDGTDPAPFEGLEDVARQLHEETPYAVSTGTIGNVFEYCTFLFGFVQTLKLVHKNPDVIIATMEHLLAYWKDYNTTFLGKVGKYLDIICINGDLAEQAGPIFRPAFYEQHVMPLDKELVDHVKRLARVKVNYHCCGSVPLFIPHFITAGFDAVNPVQVSAYDMDPCSLKDRFGTEISFWGGLCDTQHVLPFGTTALIRDDVEKNVTCLKPGGGYIAANIHNITAEVPPENIVAMFDAALEFGNY